MTPPRLLSFLILMSTQAMLVAAEPDFVRDIKPLFETRCIKCHGPSKMEGELDLSYKEATLIGGEYGPAIIEGEAENSVLMQRITLTKDEDEVMPPKGPLLTEKQIEMIRAWIEAGASWPEDLILKEVKPASKEAPASAKKERSKAPADPPPATEKP